MYFPTDSDEHGALSNTRVLNRVTKTGRTHQPLTFHLLKPFYERLLPCMHHSDLSAQEMRVYEQLALEYNIPFDISNGKHADMLRQLYYTVF